MLDEELREKVKVALKFLTLISFSGRLNQEGERAAIILAGSKIDALLCDLIKTQLITPKSKQDNLFDPDRPLGSFSSRITLANRMGLIDKKIESSLQIIRKIRNDFAHKIDFISYKDDPHNSRLTELKRLSDSSILRKLILEDLEFENSKEKIEVSDELIQFSSSVGLILCLLQIAIDENLKLQSEKKSPVYICSYEDE